MDEDWNDDDFATATYNQTSNEDKAYNGRSFGKGRGFVPREVHSQGNSYNNQSDNNRDNQYEGGFSKGGGGGFHRSNNEDGLRSYNNRDGDGNNRGGRRYGDDGGGNGSGSYNRGRRDGDDGGGNGSGSYNRGRRDGDDGGGNGSGSYNRGRRDGDDGGGNGSGSYNRGRRDDDSSNRFRNRNNDSNYDNQGGGNCNYGDKGDSKFNRNRSNNDEGDETDEKPRPPIYVPTEVEEENLFESTIQSGINFKDYEKIPVSATGSDVPRPIDSFAGANLRDSVLSNLKKTGFSTPTPIQKYSIPCVLRGRDIMATAQTGSGKTGAFAIPIINVLLAENRNLVFDGQHCQPQTLIISPTRELTIQIHNVIRQFCSGTILKSVVIYGGTSVGYQRSRILNGAHIIVATPGRLLDFVNKGIITFDSIQFIVLDEADRMLDMGFRNDIENVMNHSTMISKDERQTLMFSATFSEEIQQLAGSYLNNYVFIAVGIVGGACKDVEQVFYNVEYKDKRSKLEELLKQEGLKGTLIFIETKRNADFIASFLSERNYPTTSIHGDRFQQQREEALDDFRRGKRDILVATSVAARGLDIKGVKHVINYDLPKSIDEYVHRIGRTGRLGNYGKASSFFTPSNDDKLAPDLVKILKQAGQTVPTWLESAANNCYGSGLYESQNFGGHDYRKNDNANIVDQLPIADEETDW